MKEILVIGGTGYVGSNLIISFVGKYQDVRITSLDYYFTGKTENYIKNPKVTYAEGNTWNISNIFEKNTFDSYTNEKLRWNSRTNLLDYIKSFVEKNK